jgi:endonuclease I
MLFRLPSRLLGIAAAMALAVGVAACSDDADPIAPELGLAETDTLLGSLFADSLTNATGFAANRNGQVTAVACGPADANFDLQVITRTRDTNVVVGSDTTRVRIADTVATSRTTSTCELATFDVVAGQTYRFVVRAAEGRGAYSVCWAYGNGCGTSFTSTAAYYQAAVGKRDTALLRALFDILRSGSTTLAYDSARSLLYQSVEDPDSNNVLTDLYVGRQATVTTRGDCATCSNTVNFNAEHSWPQSRGAGQSPAQGDLHILFAADAQANNRRSNYPFGNVTGTVIWTGPADSAGQVSRLGISAQGDTVFEPRASRKGDVARAVFYFYTRYNLARTTSYSLVNFNKEEATLRQWAQQDPPDLYERRRNEVVYFIQRNRNPFIDRPEFLSEIADFPNP